MRFIKSALLFGALCSSSFGATVTYLRADFITNPPSMAFDPSLGLLIKAEYSLSAQIYTQDLFLYRVPWAPEHDSIVTTLSNIRNDYSCGGIIGPFTFEKHAAHHYPDVQLSGDPGLTGVPSAWSPDATVDCAFSGSTANPVDLAVFQSGLVGGGAWAASSFVFAFDLNPSKAPMVDGREDLYVWQSSPSAGYYWYASVTYHYLVLPEPETIWMGAAALGAIVWFARRRTLRTRRLGA
ncbi:MAG: hypothetical protein SFV18_13625 [Bryobacteraceae bacterium]|nr:hypothetical protein [Bryobacteraceae bacterium]